MKQGFYRYGKSMRLSDGAGWYSPYFKAFLQPLRYKNKMYLEGTYTPIGRDTNGLYLYIGPADHDLTRLTRLARAHDSENREFVIQRAEKVYRGEKVFYIWAILKEVSEGTSNEHIDRNG